MMRTSLGRGEDGGKRSRSDHASASTGPRSRERGGRNHFHPIGDYYYWLQRGRAHVSAEGFIRQTDDAVGHFTSTGPRSRERGGEVLNHP